MLKVKTLKPLKMEISQNKFYFARSEVSRLKDYINAEAMYKIE